MNNKGNTLVLFACLLPLIVISFLGVIIIGDISLAAKDAIDITRTVIIHNSYHPELIKRDLNRLDFDNIEVTKQSNFITVTATRSHTPIIINNVINVYNINIGVSVPMEE